MRGRVIRITTKGRLSRPRKLLYSFKNIWQSHKLKLYNYVTRESIKIMLYTLVYKYVQGVLARGAPSAATAAATIP